MRGQDDALAEAQKALDLAPSFALGYFALGSIRVFLGRFDQASDPFQRAIRLSPHEQHLFVFTNYFALALYHQGLYEEAAKIARMGIGIRPFPMLYRTLAACYGQLGRIDGRARMLAELRRVMPKDPERLYETLYPVRRSRARDACDRGVAQGGLGGVVQSSQPGAAPRSTQSRGCRSKSAA